MSLNFNVGKINPAKEKVEEEDMKSKSKSNLDFETISVNDQNSENDKEEKNESLNSSKTAEMGLNNFDEDEFIDIIQGEMVKKEEKKESSIEDESLDGDENDNKNLLSDEQDDTLN